MKFQFIKVTENGCRARKNINIEFKRSGEIKESATEKDFINDTAFKLRVVNKEEVLNQLSFYGFTTLECFEDAIEKIDVSSNMILAEKKGLEVYIPSWVPESPELFLIAPKDSKNDDIIGVALTNLAILLLLIIEKSTMYIEPILFNLNLILAIFSRETFFEIKTIKMKKFMDNNLETFFSDKLADNYYTNYEKRMMFVIMQAFEKIPDDNKKGFSESDCAYEILAQIKKLNNK